MTTPVIRTAYAWETTHSWGWIFETREEAESIPDYRDAGQTLLRLYIDEDGKVVHTEEVPA
jgi:hypothetical protein